MILVLRNPSTVPVPVPVPAIGLCLSEAEAPKEMEEAKLELSSDVLMGVALWSSGA
jgi:hypothetical protein